MISRHIPVNPGSSNLHCPLTPPIGGLPESGDLKTRVESVEAHILMETIVRCRWNKSRTAKELGLSRVGLRAKLERYGIAPGVVRRDLQ